MSLPTLTPDSIDDLIYSARSGDLPALKEDLAALSTQHGVSEASIVVAAIDAAPEAEGGTGCCLLHYPAANGNLEILTHLLTLLSQETSIPKEKTTALINHRNHSGNTALHWAALNTHLECVKVLVEACADVALTNDAGLDAVFLAERADWEVEEVKGQAQEQDQAEGEVKEGEEKEPSKGRQVVEWLLSSEKAAEIENGVGENSGEGEAGGDGEMEVDGK